MNFSLLPSKILQQYLWEWHWQCLKNSPNIYLEVWTFISDANGFFGNSLAIPSKTHMKIHSPIPLKIPSIIPRRSTSTILAFESSGNRLVLQGRKLIRKLVRKFHGEFLRQFFKIFFGFFVHFLQKFVSKSIGPFHFQIPLAFLDFLLEIAILLQITSEVLSKTFLPIAIRAFWISGRMVWEISK